MTCAEAVAVRQPHLTVLLWGVMYRSRLRWRLRAPMAPYSSARCSQRTSERPCGCLLPCVPFGRAHVGCRDDDCVFRRWTLTCDR